MGKRKVFLLCATLVLFTVSGAVAADFDWMKDLTVRAEADPSGFRASLAARFKIGDAQVTAVLSSAEKPADAYMILRLGEMSGQPVARVIETYRTGKGQGWGALAKSLGIKPGSSAFHALKRGHDLGEGSAGKGKGKEKKQKKNR